MNNLILVGSGRFIFHLIHTISRSHTLFSSSLFWLATHSLLTCYSASVAPFPVCFCLSCSLSLFCLWSFSRSIFRSSFHSCLSSRTPYLVFFSFAKPKSLPIFVSFIKQWRVTQCALCVYVGCVRLCDGTFYALNMHRKFVDCKPHIRCCEPLFWAFSSSLCR